MAKVASSGAEEALASVDSSPRRNVKKSEAFVMSGDVLISLNRNVSSTYARLLGDQLPPSTEIYSSTQPQQFSNRSGTDLYSFPSINRENSNGKISRLPVPSSQLKGVRKVQVPTKSESSSVIRMHNAEPAIESLANVDFDPIVDDDEKMKAEKNELESTNDVKIDDIILTEEVINKPLKNEKCSNTLAPSASYSSPEINENLPNSSCTTISNDVDECDGSLLINRSHRASPIDQSQNQKCTPSKRSIVTIDATACDRDESTIVYEKNKLKQQVVKKNYSINENNGNPLPHSGHHSSYSNHASTSNNTVDSIERRSSIDRDAMNLARKLYELKQYSVDDVADKLNEQTDFAHLLLVKYLEFFQFSTLRIDAALREFLSRVQLRGESSQRERLLRVFSSRYLDCNPLIFNSLDEVHTLTCALLLLNSDLHGPNNGKKMTGRDFITNIGHTGCTYKRDMLKTLYQSIKDKAIAIQPSTSQSTLKDISNSTNLRQGFLEVDPESVVEYYSGYLMKKYVREADGAKTPIGRRSWKMVYARLRGLVLYFDKDEVPKATSRYASLENAVSLHHSLAEIASDYKKKAHVIRVRIAHGGEILFQTSNETEQSEWCSKINFVAAAFSSPTLPLPVTSKPESAPMPRLPRVPCIAPITTQLKVHEARVAELNRMIDVVAASVYPERSEKLVLDRLVLLHFEKRRYSTYVNILSKHCFDRKRENPISNSIKTSQDDYKRSNDGVGEDRLSYTDAVNGYN